MAVEESGPRPGSRDNGLRADRYVLLGEVDPRIAGELLADLRAHGVAAYASPSTGERGGYLEVRLPTRPTDRVWVDADALAVARGLLDEHLAEEAPSAVDAEFERIVSGLSVATAPLDGPAPAAIDDEHFVPPPPPPLPRLHPVARWAWTAALGGLLLLLVPAMFGHAIGGGMATIAIVALLGGTAVLVYRLRDRPPTDPDDGAVV